MVAYFSGLASLHRSSSSKWRLASSSASSVTRVGRIAVIALAGSAVATRAADFIVVRLFGMALAYPAEAAAYWTAVIHGLPFCKEPCLLFITRHLFPK
jgi:hypothetical protein